MTESRKLEGGPNVGILGSGVVAQALGTGFARHGYRVTLGTREPEKLAEWKAGSPGVRAVGTFADAAKHGSFVIIATQGAGTESAVRLAGVAPFDGKLVLDATNPLDFSHGPPPGLLVGLTDSLGERVQKALPKAHVVKCFNTVSNAKMVDPVFQEGTPPMLICGDNPEAKRTTEGILREIGWPGVMDVGGIEAARWLEALVPLWVRVAMPRNAWDGAFKFVR